MRQYGIIHRDSHHYNHSPLFSKRLRVIYGQLNKKVNVNLVIPGHPVHGLLWEPSQHDLMTPNNSKSSLQKTVLQNM